MLCKRERNEQPRFSGGAAAPLLPLALVSASPYVKR
jgi:hypothetical protein